MKRIEENQKVIDEMMEISKSNPTGTEVLDKIKAEIIAESFHEDGDLSYCTIVYLGDVLGIIDKYKAESEE